MRSSHRIKDFLISMGSFSRIPSWIVHQRERFSHRKCDFGISVGTFCKKVAGIVCLGSNFSHRKSVFRFPMGIFCKLTGWISCSGRFFSHRKCIFALSVGNLSPHSFLTFKTTTAARTSKIPSADKMVSPSPKHTIPIMVATTGSSVAMIPALLASTVRRPSV